LNNIAAKAIFFRETLSEEYRTRQFKIIENAGRLANNLADLGYDVLTGGTDNHMILVNISNLRTGLTGLIAQKCLEDCGIIINMNRLPYDPKSIKITSGIRLGTPIVTRSGMGTKEMDRTSVLMDAVLKSVDIISGSEYELKKSFRDNIKNKVREFCNRFPIH